MECSPNKNEVRVGSLQRADAQRLLLMMANMRLYLISWIKLHEIVYIGKVYGI